MSNRNRLNLAESFQQFVQRLGVACTCPAPAYGVRHAWGHHKECPQFELYGQWRGYVDQVFPGRVCPGTVDYRDDAFILRLDDNQPTIS